MGVKQKIIDGMGCALDNISEERLIDILLDAYKARGKELEMLRGENAHEREMLHVDRELIAQERDRMRRDPLYCATAEYYFECDKYRYCFSIQGGRVNSFMRRGSADYVARLISREQFR